MPSASLAEKEWTRKENNASLAQKIAGRALVPPQPRVSGRFDSRMASHEVAPPAAGGSGLKITFKRTLPNPAPAPSTSAVPPPAASDHSARTSASIPAQSARSASRETSQKVKIKKPSSTADSAAHGELRSKYDALKAKYKNLEEVRRDQEMARSIY